MDATAEHIIRSPYDDHEVGRVPLLDEAGVRAAIGRAHAARGALGALPAHARASVLTRAAALIEADADGFARLMAAESGKPLRYARGEVARASETFQFAADAARSLHGETLPMDAARGGVGRVGYFVRVPVGVVGAVTPFNFPLNLVAHKVAPAIAAGCPIVLKPAPATPLTALRLADVLRQAGLPDGAFAVVTGDADVGRWLMEDARVALLSFTGSAAVGRAVSAAAGLRRVLLELGGNAAVVVAEDADIEDAARRCASGAFAYSGQVCISVQRVYVHHARYDAFCETLAAHARALRPADPLDDGALFGPMLNAGAAERVAAWVGEAVDAGARVLAGGGAAQGAIYPATVLEGAPPHTRVMAEEVFGPVVCVTRCASYEDALAAADDSAYGLQAGVFTRDLGRVLRAVERLDVGGVIVNDVPTFRVDHMPYGGNKASGVGREGPRFAVEEMTTLKMVVLNA